MIKFKSLIVLSLVFGFLTNISSQARFDQGMGCFVSPAGDECIPNTLLTAVPFLRITPDSRSGAMGDVGIAISADPNALHFNASKLAFVEQDVAFSASYTPWLRQLGLDDVYMGYLTGFKQVDDLQTIGFGLKFFSLGEISFTDINGNANGTGQPREFELSFAYARKMSKNFSAGLTGKYIYSNLASGQQVGGVEISTANAFAADISFTYNSELANKDNLSIGLALTNLGSKISYTNSTLKDFLPGNFGIGAAYSMNIDEFNAITFALDINKQLVPTPQPFEFIDESGNIAPNDEFDSDGNGIPDYREASTFGGIFGSFTDAPGGFSEELQELSYSLGLEYWYDQQFAVRAGYFYENPLKGDRQFLTLGVGLKYNVFGLNLSYLVPTNNRRSPLDNTLRFTLNFDFAAFRSSGDR